MMMMITSKPVITMMITRCDLMLDPGQLVVLVSIVQLTHLLPHTMLLMMMMMMMMTMMDYDSDDDEILL